MYLCVFCNGDAQNFWSDNLPGVVLTYVVDFVAR